MPDVASSSARSERKGQKTASSLAEAFRTVFGVGPASLPEAAAADRGSNGTTVTGGADALGGVRHPIAQLPAHRPVRVRLPRETFGGRLSEIRIRVRARPRPGPADEVAASRADRVSCGRGPAAAGDVNVRFPPRADFSGPAALRARAGPRRAAAPYAASRRRRVRLRPSRPTPSRARLAGSGTASETVSGTVTKVRKSSAVLSGVKLVTPKVGST